MNLSVLGNKIKEARETKHLTQEQLAEALGLKAVHIEILEKGEKPPKVETLINLANTLEVSVDDLLREDLVCAYEDPFPEFSDLLSKLTPEDRWRILCALRTFVECTPTPL